MAVRLDHYHFSKLFLGYVAETMEEFEVNQSAGSGKHVAQSFADGQVPETPGDDLTNSA